jgi:hypothetical protein
MPKALDLLVVCPEAGLRPDQAVQQVAHRSSPRMMFILPRLLIVIGIPLMLRMLNRLRQTFARGI